MAYPSFNKTARVWPQPGTVVSVRVFLIFRHIGIVSDRWHRGRPMVISNSARSGTVLDESWDVFAQGRTVSIQGYPGRLPAHEVLRRARSLVGTQYHLRGWNCEHLVTYAHGLKPQSPQVVATVAIALFGAVIVTADR